MNVEPWVAIGGVIATIAGALGLGEIVKAWAARRRPSKAENVQNLNDATLKWADELREDAAEARTEARAARTEAEQVRRELATIRVEAQQVSALLTRILHLIHHSPDMTLERLRTLVPEAPPDVNRT